MCGTENFVDVFELRDNINAKNELCFAIRTESIYFN